MMKRTISILILSMIIASACGYLIYTSILPEDNFLLVETKREWDTELIEGNYTDGHICFDFPMYSIDGENKIVDDWGNAKKDSFKVAYGSGNFGSGLMDSGGASGLEYVDELPFHNRERVKYADTYFFINISITKDCKLFINDTELLPGESKVYSYDIIMEYTNRFVDEENNVNNSTCLIKYKSNTTVKNYGQWKKASVNFHNIITADGGFIEYVVSPIVVKRER